MSVKDFIFPIMCIGCGSGGSYVCRKCLSQLQVLRPVCPYCEKASIDGFTHSGCVKKYGLDGLITVWKYEKVLKKAIWALKFKYASDLADEVALLFVEEIKAAKLFLPQFKFITSIPMFWYKKNLRGFNQSELLAEKIAELTGMQHASLLEKVRLTENQVDLNYSSRKGNLKDAFEIIPGCVIEKYLNIFLFDDVFTTGSTLKEACRILKKAGVQKVWGITLVR